VNTRSLERVSSGQGRERGQATRQALIEAALLRIEAGESFEQLSLRSLTRAAGVVPTAFYRHFASMDDLGLALVDESFRTLRGMLRQAREGGAPKHIIEASVQILTSYVRDHRQHFAFVTRAYSAGSILRHAVRTELKLLSSELATDLARLPVLRNWTTDDLQMVASLLVNSMIFTVEAILDAPPHDERAHAEIATTAENQMRLIALGMPAWRSGRRPQ
jgi:AcrR family transcriptional regulator